MSKTRRNFAAAHRHIKGNDDKPNNRIDRFIKKMEKKSSIPVHQEQEEIYGKINHKNYNHFLDDEEDYNDECDPIFDHDNGDEDDPVI